MPTVDQGCKAAPAPRAAPPLQQAVLNQVELRACDLESLIAPDHRARSVRQFVQSLPLAYLHKSIRAAEGRPGRPPIDPAILVALWLQATLDGVGSARELARLCDSEDADRRLCGGVEVTTTRSATSGSSRPRGWTSISRAAWPRCWPKAR
jgi:transposase